MLGRIRRLPSPALVVSAIALVLAIGGGTFAVAALSHHDKKVVKRLARKVADREIKKKAPNLSVNHASSADNAGQLGGQPADAYARAHSRGIALAGARIGTGGEVESWFNTLGGAPTVTRPFTHGYDITFPGLDNASSDLVVATPEGGLSALEAEALPTGARVIPYSVGSAPAGKDEDFYVVVYGASPTG